MINKRISFFIGRANVQKFDLILIKGSATHSIDTVYPITKEMNLMDPTRSRKVSMIKDITETSTC